MLKPKETVTADLYSQQFVRLRQAFKTKRPYNGKEKSKVMLLYDNTSLVAKMTKATIKNLDWEVLLGSLLLSLIQINYQNIKTFEK